MSESEIGNRLNRLIASTRHARLIRQISELMIKLTSKIEEAKKINHKSRISLFHLLCHPIHTPYSERLTKSFH